LASTAGGAHASAGPFSGANLFRDVETFDSFGVHRTGLGPDRRTSGWLQDHLASLGFQSELRPFAAEIYEFRSASITVASGREPLFVQEPVVQTNLRIGAPLALLHGRASDVRGAIALFDLPYNGDATINLPPNWALIRNAAEAGAVAAIAITNGPTDGLIKFNTPKDGSALPLPVLLVAPNRAAALRTAAATRSLARLEVVGANRTVTASNLISRPSGLGPVVVVSTPQSAWTHAAGERGVGVALWRAIAAYARGRKDAAWMFVATSGHELAHLGLGSVFKDPLLPGPERVRLWIHLGANIATYGRDETSRAFRLSHRPDSSRQLAVSGALRGAAETSFGALASLQPTLMGDAALWGEAKRIVEAGYQPVAGLFGPSALHHTELDRATIATGPDILAPMGAAMRRFLDTALATEPKDHDSKQKGTRR
jgi:hypothetical protein